MPDGSRFTDAFQACVRTPFATLGVSATGTHVTGIRFLAPSVAAHAPKRNTIAFLACVQLQAYLEDPRFEFDLPLALSGTRHRLAVWEAMQRIAAGKTRTYGELAADLRSSPRAVGGACGANPIPVVVPCHRVIAAGGAIGGFMGARSEGFEIGIKRWLLEHEGAC
ncbi:MAG TPA: methylated-DNA--[protein]-cysteine S-methyltransferase [Usitatibacter sp.]|nr:methylated-DNA--[protein]-cysteine S-methyltransferase [Usitatibacter sp.]